MSRMENKGIIEEIEQLKCQMEALRRELAKDKIIDDEQIEKITTRHLTKWRWSQIFLSITLAGFWVINLWRPIAHDNGQTSIGWLILCIIGTILLIYFIIFWGNWGFSFYQVADGELQHWFRFPLRKRKAIPVSQIVYIERRRKHSMWSQYYGFPIRIRYNKYDDLYINPQDVNEIICDIIRANPDIDVKQEQ